MTRQSVRQHRHEMCVMLRADHLVLRSIHSSRKSPLTEVLEARLVMEVPA